MPFGEVRLLPGVNAERTPTLLEAGYSTSNLIRFKDALAQKIGGYQKYYPFNVSGVPRALHAWQDLNATDHLSTASTAQLGVITGGSLQDITPQILISDTAPNFSTTSGSATVTIVDPNISNVTTNDAIYLNTPIAVGGLILSGAYPIVSIVGTTSYSITATSNATGTVANGGAVPSFTTASGSSVVTVLFTDHNQVAGNTIDFPLSTTGGGVTLSGVYTILSITDANHFTISATNQASSTTTFSMNSGNVEIKYYIALGPAAAGSGYGLGGYGLGGYGTGTVPSSQTGTPITATDWTIDNWGQIVLACPKGGAIYYWDPTGGFQNASQVTNGPLFNGGMFVSNSQQIVVAWGSTSSQNIGNSQDPMLVKWCDSGNFLNWVVTSTTQAGSFRIPVGSSIMGGMQTPNQNLIWTDLDLWSMVYLGPPLVYGFNKIGSGCGLASAHAAGELRGNVYWMGRSNFYVLSGNGVQVIPCPIWDVVFQDLDTANLAKIRACPNTPFNEMMWEYPSLSGGTGECDKYVKVNISEPGAPWDYGTLARSAWIDQSVLGSPIAASPQGTVYQHETTNDADGQPLTPSFTTGYFYIAEGEDFAFVDQIIPDFKFGLYNGSQAAQVQLSINVVSYPGDTPTVYGPYVVTNTTEYVPVRFRGRQMSFTVTSTDIGSFWRLGKVRYRFSPDGRR